MIKINFYEDEVYKMSMTYEEAMEYIESVGRFGSNYGLRRTFRLLEILGNPQEKLKLIHVAGTNGKGSTTAMITKMLRGLGYKVGMYTSPYLEEFEERIQINGVNIRKDTFVELLEEVKKAVDKVIEEYLNENMSYNCLIENIFLYSKCIFNAAFFGAFPFILNILFFIGFFIRKTLYIDNILQLVSL